jgi:hypothetical protein
MVQIKLTDRVNDNDTQVYIYIYIYQNITLKQMLELRGNDGWGTSYRHPTGFLNKKKLFFN